MSYDKTQWQDHSQPFLEAKNLNKIEQGIEDAHTIAESKQDDLGLGNPGDILSTNQAGNDTEWIPNSGTTDVEWGDIEGTLSNQTDLQAELDTKALGSDLASHIADDNNPHNVDKVDVELGNVENIAPSDMPISDATQTALDNKAALNHGHEISDVNGLQTALDAKMDDGDAYLKDEFINSSGGAADSGKPIVLNANGVIDDTMINISGYYPVGYFTPTAGSEYPDTSAESPGATWTVDGVDDSAGYTFTGGDLAGETAHNGDRMIFGDTSWILEEQASFDEDAFYKRDGTQPITDHFQGAGFQVKNIADGTDAQDAVTINQMDSFSGGFVKTDGTSTMTGNFDLGGMKSVNTVAGSAAGEAVEYEQFNTAINERAPADHDHEIADITNLQNELNSKALESDLTAHTGNTSNPHGVTAEQTDSEPTVAVGSPGQVWTTNAAGDGKEWTDITTNTDWGDIGGTLSNQTDLQTALDAKEDSLGLGTAGQVLATNQAADGKEWVDAPLGAVWGSVTGTLTDQTDLNNELNARVKSVQEGGVGTRIFNDIVVTQVEYDALTPVTTTRYTIVG